MKVSAPAIVLASVIVSLGSAGTADAEATAYMSIKGTKQSEIKGSVVLKGREGTIAVVGFDHSLGVPTDPVTGQATGTRRHKPFQITKAIDRSSPALYQALITQEVLKDVVIQLWQPSASGAETNYYTITLQNARIASIVEVSPDNRLPENAQLSASEQVQFVYQSITWTWIAGGVTASDGVESLR